MQAYLVTSFDTPAQLADLPTPRPGPGQLGVKIAACGLNFADLLMQKGTYQDTPEPPFVPGLEIAGTVTELGDDVSGFEVGDRVAVYCGEGGLAEIGAFDANRAVPIPDGMSFEDAAALQIAYGRGQSGRPHDRSVRSGVAHQILRSAWPSPP